MSLDTKIIKKILSELDNVGDMILSYYHTNYNIETKDDQTPVTDVDIKADKMIRDILEKHTPKIHIISEEVKIPDYEIRKNINLFWIVDPLDGTKEFINKTDEFAINIALIDNGVPVVGFIHLPVKRETYFAQKNRGVNVYKNGKILPLKELNTLNNIALISRSHKDDEALKILKNIENKYSLSFIKKVLGSSHKQIAIANGDADLYIKVSKGPSEWDFAAGQILIEESGGEILDLYTNRPPIYNKEDLGMSGFIMKSKKILEKIGNCKIV